MNDLTLDRRVTVLETEFRRNGDELDEILRRGQQSVDEWREVREVQAAVAKDIEFIKETVTELKMRVYATPAQLAELKAELSRKADAKDLDATTKVAETTRGQLWWAVGIVVSVIIITFTGLAISGSMAQAARLIGGK
jgi:chromosome segregation ATPase